MKIILLYGPGEVNKRTELLKYKKNYSEDSVSVIDLDLQGISDIKMELASNSLFETGDKLIIVENTPDSFDFADLVKNSDNPATIIFIAGIPTGLSKIITSAKKAGVLATSFEAEKEQTAFTYLDCLIEGKKEAFFELEKLLSSYGGMYVLSMIYYLLRRNLLPLPASSFMQEKIKVQKKDFSISDWQKLYHLVLQKDYAIKNGALPEGIALSKLTEEIISFKTTSEK